MAVLFVFNCDFTFISLCVCFCYCCCFILLLMSPYACRFQVERSMENTSFKLISCFSSSIFYLFSLFAVVYVLSVCSWLLCSFFVCIFPSQIWILLKYEKLTQNLWLKWYSWIYIYMVFFYRWMLLLKYKIENVSCGSIIVSFT